MALNSEDIAQFRTALQDAVVKCSERCLYASAKWAAELLNALPETDDADDMADTTFTSPIFTPNNDPTEAALEAKELSKYLLAKSFFDYREFDRCAAVFLPDSLLSSVLNSRSEATPVTPKGKEKVNQAASARSSTAVSLPRLSQKSLFLALYAKFMAGEKRRQEESEMVMGPQDLGTVTNKELLIVGRYLAAWFEERTNEDGEVAGSQGWLEYLYGMVLSKEKNVEQALEFLVRSANRYPFNWGCWQEITSLISRPEELNQIAEHCPEHIVAYMFHLHASLELYQHSSSLINSCERLSAIFPTSGFLQSCNALLSYHAKDFITAEQHFSRLLAQHPHRLDALDHYSNILYVLGLRPKLAFLAHLASSIDRFRPESCVIIGNYYSLLSMHEKAVQYFKRALVLDRSCLAAWTLLGHEYVELKNSHAALESYRRAVDINRRDYRAWYGLGQIYEMMEMHTYSLWYYKKAAGLRPWDGKMWMAVGSTLHKMGRHQDGIKALKRALMADSYYDTGSSFASSSQLVGGRAVPGQMDPDVLLQIAQMYNVLGELLEAKAYMELCVAQEYGDSPNGDDNMAESVRIHNDSPPGSDDGAEEAANNGPRESMGPTQATGQARMWLAKFAMSTEDYSTANRLANELCHDGVDVEEAKALMREVRSRAQASGASMMLEDLDGGE